jgi:hypothetical protein
MRRAVICIVATVMIAVIAIPSIAETKLPGIKTQGQIDLYCLDAGGQVTSGSGPGGFGCKTDKGEISCTKTGTLNQGPVGSCVGCNPSCGMDASGGSRTTSIRDILSLPAGARPLEPLAASGETTNSPAQSKTQSPGDAPMHQLTPQ